LAEDFRSYETASEVRNELKASGVASQWQEAQSSLPLSDRRPTYNFLTMSGPFTVLGVGGSLKLIFYNDRLMTTEFSTARGSEVISALRTHGIATPSLPGREVTLDRRTSFRYYLDADRKYRFSWTDAKLEAEWLKWIQKHS